MFRSPVHAGAVILFAITTIVATGCARRKMVSAAPPAPPRPVRIGDTELGIASWYGDPYHGRRAASGEIYDMEQLTAAHRTLPFGTWLEVTNLGNRKQVNVRVTDRGPFVDGRIIDLSRAAAREIEMLGPGTARVQLKVIAAPEPSVAAEMYAVQAGAFSSRERAEAFCDSLRDQFADARVLDVSSIWRVIVGRQLSFDEANQIAARLRKSTGQAVVILDR